MIVHSTNYASMDPRQSSFGVFRIKKGAVTSTQLRRRYRLTAVNRKQDIPPKIQEFGFLRTFEEDYELGDLLGKGSFSSVYAATHRQSGESYAIKSMRKQFKNGFLTDHFTSHVHHEVDILTKLGPSLNVAYLYGIYESDKKVDLVMERCQGGPLWDRIKKGAYSEHDAAGIVKDILRAVAQCHSKDIVIRDVKPENFLFLSNCQKSPLKAIDFGLAKYCSVDDVLEDRAGTPMYIAPEILRRSYGQKADLWSVGIIAYQLLTGRMPFLDDEGESVTRSYMERHVFSNKDMFRAVLHAKIDFRDETWSSISSNAVDFVKRLLKRDPKYRPTAEEALSHPWLKEGASPSVAPFDNSIVQRLQRFGTYGKLKQAALKKVASFVADDPTLFSELKAGFLKLDMNGTGKVPRKAIDKLLNNGTFDMSHTETEQLLAQLKSDADGCIDYTTWLAAIIDWKQLQECPVWNTWMQEVFELFDVDHSGALTKKELTQILCGEYCELPDTVPAVLRDVDSSGDGLVSLEEFMKIMQSETSDKLELFDDRI